MLNDLEKITNEGEDEKFVIFLLTICLHFGNKTAKGHSFYGNYRTCPGFNPGYFMLTRAGNYKVHVIMVLRPTISKFLSYTMAFVA